MQDLDRTSAKAVDAPPGPGRRGVLRSATLLGTATVIAKLAALAKDWLVARQLGAGDDLDAYLIAFLLPSYAAVVLGHSFASAFMPTYIRVWEHDGLARSQRLFGNVLAVGIGILALITVLLLAGGPFLLPIVAPDFDPAKLSLTLALFYPLAAVVGAAGLSAMLAGVLNAHERFWATACAPMAIPLGTLAVFWAYADRFGVHALAVGTTVGFIGELAVLVVAVARLRLFTWPRLGPLEGNLKHVGSQYLPVVVGALLMSSATMIDQAMAASLGSGQVSILSYGGKIVATVLAAVAVSLSTVMLPRFSRMIAGNRRAELAQLVRSYARAIILASIPLVALLALFSEPLVRLLFQRGAFTPETTHAAARVQLWLLPQIPFYVLAMLGSRVLSALDGNQTVLRIGALNVAVNVAGNYVLMQWFGVEGIAISTSLVYVVAAGSTLLAIRQKLDGAGRREAAGASQTDV